MMPLKYTNISFNRDLGGEPLGISPKTGKCRPNVEAESASVFGEYRMSDEDAPCLHLRPCNNDIPSHFNSGYKISPYTGLRGFPAPSRILSMNQPKLQQYGNSTNSRNGTTPLYNDHLSPTQLLLQNPYPQQWGHYSRQSSRVLPTRHYSPRQQASREPTPYYYSPSKLHSQPVHHRVSPYIQNGMQSSPSPYYRQNNAVNTISYPQHPDYYRCEPSREPSVHQYRPSELNSQPVQQRVSPNIQNCMQPSPSPYYRQNNAVNTISYPQHPDYYRCEPSREPTPRHYCPSELNSQPVQHRVSLNSPDVVDQSANLQNNHLSNTMPYPQQQEYYSRQASGEPPTDNYSPDIERQSQLLQHNVSPNRVSPNSQGGQLNLLFGKKRTIGSLPDAWNPRVSGLSDLSVNPSVMRSASDHVNRYSTHAPNQSQTQRSGPGRGESFQNTLAANRGQLPVMYRK